MIMENTKLISSVWTMLKISIWKRGGGEKKVMFTTKSQERLYY